MASLGSLVLTIERRGASADVTIDYTITFSTFDIASQLPYTVSVRLIGDDDDLDGADDALGHRLTGGAIVRADGRTSVARSHHTVVAFDALHDTDRSADEPVRAVVDLMPMLPVAVSRVSNVVVLEDATQP